MLFIETRGNDGVKPQKVKFSDAILNPSASFGGLYVPESLPSLNIEELKGLSYKDLALKVLKSFEIDISDEVLKEALSLYDNFDNPADPVPVVSVGADLHIAELYHGPTRAFKDMALQPFGKVLSHLAQSRNEKYLILAATSGDTGPATLETFKERDGVRVVCLYPDGGTSDVQRLQMVTEDGSNLKVLGINGAFDDAQNSLKKLLGSDEFRGELADRGVNLSAANSVNFGRIIFQTIYHIHSYLKLLQNGTIENGEKIYLTVPSGNFGNALGGFYAKEMGLPIEKILIASNSNNILTDLITTGKYSLNGRDVVNTKSPAMDILKSSNVERVLYTMFGAERVRELMESLENSGEYSLTADELAEVRKVFDASFSTDEECMEGVEEFYERGYLLDPHTATAIKAHRELRDEDLQNVAYSTAEWTKFSPSIVDALGSVNSEEVGAISDREALNLIADKTSTTVPEQIEDLFSKPVVHDEVIEISELQRAILSFLDK
jgi:threonine synthase